MNKLIALQIGEILANIDLAKMEKADQFAILDDILSCNKIREDAKKQIEAVLGDNKDNKEKLNEANKLVNEKLESEKLELKKISSKSFDLVLKQGTISAGALAVLYKHIVKTK